MSKGGKSWIDRRDYVGLDRRERRAGLRLLERRQRNGAGEPPPLTTAMRQLRMCVLDAHSADGLAAFRRRANAVVQLANTQGDVALATQIAKLLRELATRPGDGDLRPVIEAELGRISSAWSQRQS